MPWRKTSRLLLQLCFLFVSFGGHEINVRRLCINKINYTWRNTCDQCMNNYEAFCVPSWSEMISKVNYWDTPDDTLSAINLKLFRFWCSGSPPQKQVLSKKRCAPLMVFLIPRWQPSIVHVCSTNSPMRTQHEDVPSCLVYDLQNIVLNCAPSIDALLEPQFLVAPNMLEIGTN